MYKLQVLIGQISPGDHSGAIPGAGMCRCAGEVGAPVTTGGEHRVLGVEAMQCPVLQTERDHTSALAAFHQQIEGKILDEIVAVIAQRLTVECVQQRVAGPVGHATASVSLATLAELKRLTAEGTLIDPA